MELKGSSPCALLRTPHHQRPPAARVPPPRCSPAVVQSSLWAQEASQLRQWLDDVPFTGGGQQPVALAEALLEAACLFELPCGLQAPGGAAVQRHCLVCMVSDPAPGVVSWPFPPPQAKVGFGWVLGGGGGWLGWPPFVQRSRRAGCARHCQLSFMRHAVSQQLNCAVSSSCSSSSGTIPCFTSLLWCNCRRPPPPPPSQWVRLPGLATSVEMVHALQARAVTLSLATRLRAQKTFSASLVYHWLHTLTPPQVRGDTGGAGKRLRGWQAPRAPRWPLQQRCLTRPGLPATLSASRRVAACCALIAALLRLSCCPARGSALAATRAQLCTPYMLHAPSRTCTVHRLPPPLRLQVPPVPLDTFLREHSSEYRTLTCSAAKTAGGSVVVMPHWDQVRRPK